MAENQYKGKFVFNGVEYFGNKFQVKDGKLFVDGHCVADLRENTEYLTLEGEGTLECDKSVVINGFFSGTINAERVVLNDSEVIGQVNAQKVIHNK